MKVFSKKSKMVIPLTAATVLIWGFIIYNIVVYFNSSDDLPVEALADAYNLPAKKHAAKVTDPEVNIEYVKLERDPFLFPRIEIPKKKTVVPVKQIPKTPTLNYRISGIIVNEKSKLVIFEDNTNKTTVFLHEGETYKSIKINRISDLKINLMEDGEKKEVYLNK